MKLEISPQRRSALYTPVCDLPSLGLKGKEPTKCFVLGLFPAYDESSGDVYFIIELLDGRCAYAPPNNVQFTDTDENGVIME